MSDSIYKPPETDPEWDEKKPSVKPWSQRKLLFLTFLPFSLCLLASLGVNMNEIGSDNSSQIYGLIYCLIAGAPLSAVVIAIWTAVHFTEREGEMGLNFVGYLLFWALVHIALLFTGVCACGVIA